MRTALITRLLTVAKYLLIIAQVLLVALIVIYAVVSMDLALYEIIGSIVLLFGMIVVCRYLWNMTE